VRHVSRRVWCGCAKPGGAQRTPTRERMPGTTRQCGRARLALHARASHRTSPNTTCLPLSQGVSAVQMKNWLPLVLGPAGHSAPSAAAAACVHVSCACVAAPADLPLQHTRVRPLPHRVHTRTRTHTHTCVCTRACAHAPHLRWPWTGCQGLCA
jgi:hypothetical protein